MRGLAAAAVEVAAERGGTIQVAHRKAEGPSDAGFHTASRITLTRCPASTSFLTGFTTSEMPFDGSLAGKRRSHAR